MASTSSETFQPSVWTLPGKGDAKWCFYSVWGVRISAQSKNLKETLPWLQQAGGTTTKSLNLQGCRSNANTPGRTADVTADTEHTESRFLASFFHSSLNWQWEAKCFSHLFTLFFPDSQHREHIYSTGKEGNEVMCITCRPGLNFDRRFLLHGIIFVLCSKR